MANIYPIPILSLPVLPGPLGVNDWLAVQSAGSTYRVDASTMPLSTDTLVTWNDQTARLPFSRVIEPGTNIAFDTSVPNKLIISTNVTSIPGNAATATALQTARMFDVLGLTTVSPVSFDGTANVGIQVTGVPFALITGLPTTLAGYGITNAYTKTEIDGLITGLGSVYQPLSTTLTSVAALANAAGVLTNDGSGALSWAPASGTGTVTSVGASTPTGLTVSGSPITASGTLAFTWTAGYQGYTSAEASKLAGIAAGATVGATWGTNLNSIPAAITAYAGGDTPSAFTLGIVASADAAAWRAAIGANDAANISSGTLADARLSSNVPLKNAANVFTADQNLTAGVGQGRYLYISGNGIAAGAGAFFGQSSLGAAYIGTQNAAPLITVINGQPRGAVSPAGNWVFEAPDSGTGVTVYGGLTLASGSLTLPAASIADAALSSNVPLKNASNTFTNAINSFDGGADTRLYLYNSSTLTGIIQTTPSNLSIQASGASNLNLLSNGNIRATTNSSGNWVFNAADSGVTLTTWGTASAATEVQRWTDGTRLASLYLANTGPAVQFGSSGSLLLFSNTGVNGLTLNTGLQIGSPSGGDMGPGTLNSAGEIYVNGLEVGFATVPRRTSGFANGQCTAVSATTGVGTGFPAGTCFSIYNDSGSSINVTQGSGLTMRLAGTATTGDRILAARGMCTIWYNSTTECVISGPGVT